MANDLTGDYDVAAEFAIPAVNRVLAAMHQCERFLHSISVRVDDNPPPGSISGVGVAVGSVDGWGYAIANQQQIGKPNPSPGPKGVTDPALALLDPVVNIGEVYPVPITPSHLQGSAQLQLFPPTADIPDASGMNLAIRMDVMARYFPDKGTSPLAEFIRGDLEVIAPVNQITSGVGNVINIDFKADQAQINFTPSYASDALIAEDLAGINLLIANALRTSFLPSDATLPSNVTQVHFRTLSAPQKAISVLLNLTDHAASASGANNALLAAGDDFAFAAGRDYVLGALKTVTDNLLSQSFPEVKFSVLSYHLAYSITLTNATGDLEAGKIVLTTQGDAKQLTHHSWAPGDFGFTLTLEFSLQAWGGGTTAVLVPGQVSVNTTSLEVDLFNAFSGAITDAAKQARDQALQASGADETVTSMFDAAKNLGDFLNSLLQAPGGGPPPPQKIVPLYTSVAIQPSGVVCHGSLPFLFQWPEPHLEFEQIPANSDGSARPIGSVPPGPDYSALNTWIPGGTISGYGWSAAGQGGPAVFDDHKFVLLARREVEQASAEGQALAAVAAYTPLCLTVQGTRLSYFGPIVAEPVSAMVCGYTRVPVVTGVMASNLGVATAPAVTLTRPGPSGQVQVTGHALAQVAPRGTGAPNLLVHFADAKSAAQLKLLTQAVAESKRQDAATAVLAVLSANELSKAPYTPGVIYTEDQNGAWEAILRVSTAKRPLTLVVGPRGAIIWQREGPLDRQALAAALAEHLVKTAAVQISLPQLNVRIGQRAPNFVFEYVPGQEFPLRKLAGGPANLVFWKSSSRASIQAVLYLQNGAVKAANKTAPLLLAINDGEASDLARKVAAEAGISAILVTDPKREISLAYGVDLWPTIVSVDATGLIAGIRHGYASDEDKQTPPKPTATSGQRTTGPAVHKKTPANRH